MTLGEFMDKVPWRQMELTPSIDGRALIRACDNARRCPLMVVAGYETNCDPDSLARRLRLRRDTAWRIAHAADATAGDPRLRNRMLGRMARKVKVKR